MNFKEGFDSWTLNDFLRSVGPLGWKFWDELKSRTTKKLELNKQETLEEILEDLRRRHNIPPENVGKIVEANKIKAILISLSKGQWGLKGLSTPKDRRRHVGLFRKAAVALRPWKSMIGFEIFDLCEGVLLKIAVATKTFPSLPYTQRRSRQGLLARDLADCFKKYSPDPLYLDIGKLVHLTYPEWNPVKGRRAKRSLIDGAKGFCVGKVSMRRKLGVRKKMFAMLPTPRKQEGPKMKKCL
jgi:hypothetical protein